MIYLVFYDISDDKIRQKVAGRLVVAGYERLQLSVFSGIKNPKANPGLWKELQALLAAEASAKFYAVKISKNNFKNIAFIGEAGLDIDYLLGLKNSLFI